jgi:hypothetical protein
VEKSYQITIFKAFTTSPRGVFFHLNMVGVSGVGQLLPGGSGLSQVEEYVPRLGSVQDHLNPYLNKSRKFRLSFKRREKALIKSRKFELSFKKVVYDLFATVLFLKYGT